MLRMIGKVMKDSARILMHMLYRLIYCTEYKLANHAHIATV